MVAGRSNNCVLEIYRRGHGPVVRVDRERYPKTGPDNPIRFPQNGTPYVIDNWFVQSPLGAPCTEPPWGRLTATILASFIDREEVWSLSEYSPLVEPSFATTGQRIVATKLLDLEPRRYNITLAILRNGSVDEIDLPNETSFLTQAKWSPDSKTIVCRSNKMGLGDVGVIDIEKRIYTPITTHPMEDRDPSFAPDGARIVFASDRTGNFELYSIQVDGTGLQRLTNTRDQDEVQPVFSPDGTRIAYVAVRASNEAEEAVAIEPAIQLPAPLQTGRYLPDAKETRFSAWRLSLAWRSAHNASVVLLGAYGELIGTNPSSPHPTDDVLYFARDGDRAILHHSGPEWRGMYAVIDENGTVRRATPIQDPEAADVPIAKYGEWPYRDNSGGLVTIPDGQVIAPISEVGELDVVPIAEVGWMIELASGDFYVPDQDAPRPEDYVSVLSERGGFVLMRRDSEMGRVVENRSFSVRNDERRGLFWPYADGAGRPAFPPSGHRVSVNTTDSQPQIISSTGRITGPGIETP